MFKRSASALAILIAVLPVLPAQATALPNTFTFQGSGYGHGVGMSQVGARGLALESATADTILNYYYRGTTIETVTDAIELRVNVGHLLQSSTIKTDTASSEILIFSQLDSITPVARVLPGAQLQVNVSGNNLRFTGPNIDLSAPRFTLRWSGTRYLAGSPSSIFLGSGKTLTQYRYGQLNFSAVRSGKNSSLRNYQLDQPAR
jgi:hypothetical protein